MKRFYVAISLLLASLLSLQSYAGQQGGAGNRPTVGLALSGGGARGFAHIAVLQTIDSLQIPVDYIAGTSMGGVIGALYAIGYNGKEIESIVRDSDWPSLFSDKPPRALQYLHQKEDDGKYHLTFGFEGITPIPPTGLINGQKISLLFSRLTVSAQFIRDFDQLYVPFQCVAADLITGHEVVLDQGCLPKAMRATMSIPSAFTPVPWGDSLLVDGGIINNLPVDVVKRMGADIIIAVDVGRYQYPKEELSNLISIMEQASNIPVLKRLQRQRREADLLIMPEVLEFSTVGFEESQIGAIIQKGRQASRGKISEWIKLRQKMVPFSTDHPGHPTRASGKNVLFGISITGNQSIPFEELYQYFALQPGDTIRFDDFHAKIAKLHQRSDIAQVHYYFTPVDSNKMRVSINIRETERPVIHRVSIEGNKSLPFRFINNRLAIRPGERFDPEKLTEKINLLYSLGYFKTIGFKANSCLKIKFT